MVKNGKRTYVPPVVLKELEIIKLNNNLSGKGSQAKAFGILVKNGKILNTLKKRGIL